MQKTYILLAVHLVDTSFTIIKKHLLNDIRSFELITNELYSEGGMHTNYHLLVASTGCGIGDK